MVAYLPQDACLQCGETRESVKRNEYFCATLTGYEQVEVKDEWERHHWRDWSNTELENLGIHPSFWDEYRRSGVYDLDFAIGSSICLERGHLPIDDWPEVCACCWSRIDGEESGE